MRALLVVVAEVLAEDRFKVAPPEYQGPVEALRAYGPHKTLRVGVRSRRPDGGLDHLDGFRSEDLVEAGGELCVVVPDKELHRAACLCQAAGQVPGDLGDEAVVRVLGHAEEICPPGLVLDGEEHVQLLEEHGV